MNTENQQRVLRMKQLTIHTSFSRSYIYQKIKEGKFPPGYLISPGIRAWLKSEINDWLDKRMRGEG
tara:strand:- start:812 stop:1009 length:198 start_codon:yes stop_codon:yes gene_type:complete